MVEKKEIYINCPNCRGCKAYQIYSQLVIENKMEKDVAATIGLVIRKDKKGPYCFVLREVLSEVRKSNGLEKDVLGSCPIPKEVEGLYKISESGHF